MKHSDPLYNQTIKELKRLQPNPENPDKLAREIMAKIENQPQQSKIGNSRVRVIRLFPKIAVSLVIGLFVYEIIKPPQSPDFNTIPFPESHRFSHVGNSHYSMGEKVKQYIRWQKIQTQKIKYREELVSNFQLSNPKP